MRRRDILAGAGSFGTAAATSFPAPAIAQGLRQLKMVTDWPDGSPGLQYSAIRLAETIGSVTGGRIKVEVFSSGALVRPFETFDAVSAGVADIYHSTEYYWEKKSPAFSFFAAVPFGFTADELFAWVHHGGAQAAVAAARDLAARRFEIDHGRRPTSPAELVPAYLPAP